MSVQQLSNPPSTNWPVQANEIVAAGGQAWTFSRKQDTTSGLTVGVAGGPYLGTDRADTTLTCTDNTTNYIVALRSDGTRSVSTAQTNWNDTVTYGRVARAVFAAGVLTWLDARDDPGGIFDASAAGGLPPVPQNSQSAAYTLVLADAGKQIYHPSSDANARTFTIPANSSVAFPIGTQVMFINETSQVVTIAITTDTLVLAGAGTTGSRSLAQNGVATAIKVGATRWFISGTGVT